MNWNLVKLNFARILRGKLLNMIWLYVIFLIMRGGRLLFYVFTKNKSQKCKLVAALLFEHLFLDLCFEFPQIRQYFQAAPNYRAIRLVYIGPSQVAVIDTEDCITGIRKSIETLKRTIICSIASPSNDPIKSKSDGLQSTTRYPSSTQSPTSAWPFLSSG